MSAEDVEKRLGIVEISVASTQEVISSTNLKQIELEAGCRGTKRRNDPCEVTGKPYKLRKLLNYLLVALMRESIKLNKLIHAFLVGRLLVQERIEEVVEEQANRNSFLGRIIIKAQRLVRRRVIYRKMEAEEMVFA